MQRRLRCLVAALLAPCAMAQTPEQDRQREYYRQQDQQREEQQRRAQDEYQRQLKATDDEKKKRQGEYDDDRKKDDAPQHGAAEAPGRRAQAAQDAQNNADFQAARAKLLRMPPLPDERNPLLGRWRVEGGFKPQRKDELGLLMGMLANPGGAACQMMFGGGITEFKSKSWASIDGRGENSLGPIVYRGDGKRVWAIPDKAIGMMGFEVVQQHRAVSVNLEGCALVRVGGATPTAQGGSTNRVPGPTSADAPQASARGYAATARGTPTATASVGAALVDGAAFRCPNGSHFFVSLCQGPSAEAMCKLSDPTVRLDMGALMSRAAIAAKVQGCEAGGIRYGADDKPIFVKQPA